MPRGQPPPHPRLLAARPRHAWISPATGRRSPIRVSSLGDHEVCGKLMVPCLGLLAHDVVHQGSYLRHRNSHCSASCRQPSPVPPLSSNLMDSKRALILESRRRIVDTRGHREEVVCAGLERQKDAQGRTSLAVTAMPRF